jgi:hypothetical protein
MPKIIVSADMAITNSKNERSMYCQKQSQTNPNLPAIALATAGKANFTRLCGG